MLTNYKFLWTVFSRTGDQSSMDQRQSVDHHFKNHCCKHFNNYLSKFEMIKMRHHLNPNHLEVFVKNTTVAINWQLLFFRNTDMLDDIILTTD